MAVQEFERVTVGRVVFNFHRDVPTTARDGVKAAAPRIEKELDKLSPPLPGLEPQLVVLVWVERGNLLLRMLMPPNWVFPQVPEAMKKLMTIPPDFAEMVEAQRKYAEKYKAEFEEMYKAVAPQIEEMKKLFQPPPEKT